MKAIQHILYTVMKTELISSHFVLYIAFHIIQYESELLTAVDRSIIHILYLNVLEYESKKYFRFITST